MPETLTSGQIAQMIDFALLKPDMSDQDIAGGIKTAILYGAGTVFVRPTDAEFAAEKLEGLPIKLASVVGFPYGFQPTCAKVTEALHLLDAGCQELDMVINIGQLKSGHLDFVKNDMAAVADVVHERGRIAKVIFENGYLTDAEKKAACRAAEAAGMDFVKTATGMGPGGATLSDLKLMRAASSSKVQVKAAGGIRSLDQLLSAVAVGATRIGTSAIIGIVTEARQRELSEPILVTETVPLGNKY